jgi:hypothetical protein
MLIANLNFSVKHSLSYIRMLVSLLDTWLVPCDLVRLVLD